MSKENDLIRRGDVLKILYKFKDNKDCPKNYGTLLDIINEVSKVPLAYNLEEVIEHLELLKVYEADGGCPKQGVCTKRPYECTTCYTTTALEIVKGRQNEK